MSDFRLHHTTQLLRGEKKELQDEIDQLRKKNRGDNGEQSFACEGGSFSHTDPMIAEEISKLRDRFAADSDTIRRLERERLDAISERNTFEVRAAWREVCSIQC
jgi:hypothetical protein